MNVRRADYLLRVATVLCGTGAFLVVILAVFLPLERVSSVSAAAVKSPPRSTPAQVHQSALENLLDLDLRRPLADVPAPPPPLAPAPVTIEVPPPFHLAGTVVEPGHSVALFTGPAGKPEFKSVGDSIGGGKIIAIDEHGATVLWNGRTLNVSVESRAGAGVMSAAPASRPAEADEDRR